jgi:hypothetical protein
MSDLYSKISLLRFFGGDVLILREKAPKSQLQEVLLLGIEIHSQVTRGSDLYPMYLGALDHLRPNIGSLLFLPLSEVMKIIPEKERGFDLPWGIHFSEIYQEALLPWSKTLGISPAEIWYSLPEVGNPPSSMARPDGSWNSDLTREELLWFLR